MKQMKRVFVLVLTFVFLFTAFAVFAGGQKSGGTKEKESKYAEQSKQYKEKAGMYPLFEKYREYAKKHQPYPGQPGKGKKLGFANIYATQPFCISVQNSIIEQAKLAGFSRDNLIIMDNQYNSVIGLKNADIMLSKHPDFFIEYQADAKVNNIVAQKFGAAHIPILAVDVPVPGAPFMGVNNWKVAVMAGKYAAKLIKEQWGGWDAVDLVVLLQMPAGGEVTMLRSEGFAAALDDIFGKDAEKKIVRVDGGMGQSEQAKKAMDDVLAAHPKAKKMVITSINEQTMAGVIASLQNAGRWSAEDTIIVTQGCDALGRTQIREGLTDGAVAYFPEKYGEYIIPAVCAILQGQPVPPYIYIDNVVITKDNIDKYYPKK